jgi:tetratricopeptide (TPR) repeat protein
VSTDGRTSAPPEGAARSAGEEPSRETLGGVVTNTAAGSPNIRSGGPSAPPPLPAGTAVGRYRIVELLGTGGGGSVYRAHDPELSRDIALKVLHHGGALAGAESEYSRRLLREAKALAMLSHPNVVAAYDVGTFGDSLFVAMELVQGESLRKWLQREKRELHEIMRVLLAVGNGLIAAHAAGVMHRDIKPANVMVSVDGNVRIVDFGLARAVRSESEPTNGNVDANAAATAPAPSTTTEVTDTAVLSGTPGYIAPEVLFAEPVIDAQADQFSYAVTAFLALTGQKPYSGNTLSEYMAALARGERAAWPRWIPHRIRRVIDRGLERRHVDRYPSMQALVKALEKASAPSRLPLALTAFGLGAVLVMALTLVEGRATRETCQVDAAPFSGIWDSERRRVLESELRSTGRVNAGEAFGLLAARLDAFERDWVAMREDACQATHVRGEQSEHVLGLRNSCLDRKLKSVAALVDAFSHPESSSVDRAAAAMPESIQECADTAILLGEAETLPADPGLRAGIQEVESAIGVTRALTSAGRPNVVEQARQVLASAKKMGHEPLIAKAVVSLGHALILNARSGAEHEEGDATLREGMRLAAQVGDEHLFARTASHLFVELAYAQRRIQEAETMLPVVEGLVGLTGNDVEQRLEVLMARAIIASQRRRYEEATRVFEQVIALSPSSTSDRKAYGSKAQGEIGKIELELKRYPEAVRRFEAELAGIRAQLGQSHPRVVFSLVNLGLAQSKAGLREQAWATVGALRQLVSSLYPPGDWRYATVAYVSGNVWEESGDCERALPLYLEALQTVQAKYGAKHSNAADVQSRVGSCLHALGRGGEAVSPLENALEIRNAAGAAPNVRAAATFQLSEVLWTSRPQQRARAIALAEQAVSLWREDQVTDRVQAAEEWLARHRPRLPRRAATLTSSP